jgi:hypothetical protein
MEWRRMERRRNGIREERDEKDESLERRDKGVLERKRNVIEEEREEKDWDRRGKKGGGMEYCKR